MSTFSVSFTFVANTKAKASEVNQNFTDTLNILSAHHHDPNLYTGASPVTNSGIAANAKILDTQLNTPITRSGPINDASVQVITVPKGGLNMASASTGEIIVASGTNQYIRIPPGADGSALTMVGTIPQWKAQSVAPTGTLIMWAGGTTPPSGYLLCDGSAVSRASFAELFAVIGTTYGAGDGSTTFNLPNLQGRVPVGFDSGQTEFDAMGETGGAKTHTLTVSEIPSHSHTTEGVSPGSSPNNFTGHSALGAEQNAQDSSVGSTGGGGAHNNLQPYITLRFIIRT
jgi:microcystin-dependent protein